MNTTAAYLPVIVSFKLVHPDAVLPKKAHDEDAGYDITSVEEVTLVPGRAPVAVATGLVLGTNDIPFHHYFKIESRSGLALKGVSALGGIIDRSYRGEIKVILTNHTSQSITLPKGSRIAQLIAYPILNVKPVEVDEVSKTARGSGGFGSTGV